jgi:hypothetical protein
MYMLRVRKFRNGSFACARRLLLIAVCLLAHGPFNQSADGATLAELLNGASINLGNSRFSNWQLISLSSTATESPDLSQIMVTPLVNDPSNPGLQFLANGQLAASGINSIDFVFKFRIDAMPGGKTITSHALALTDITLGSTGGLAEITDEISGSSGNSLDPAIVFSHMGSIFTQPSNFAQQSTVFVTTNVLLNGLSATDAVNLEVFTQRFSQTGPAFLAADFDEDGNVDGGDLAKWKLGFGVKINATHAQGDANADGAVNGGDLLVWQRQLGSAASAAAVAASAAVPEPSTAILVLMGSALAGSFRRRGAVR